MGWVEADTRVESWRGEGCAAPAREGDWTETGQISSKAASTPSNSQSTSLQVSVIAVGEGRGDQRAPQTVAESSVWGGACSTEVAADSRLLTGRSIKVRHRPRAVRT